MSEGKDVIDVEAAEVPSSVRSATALAIMQRDNAGLMAMASLSDVDFKERLAVLKRGAERIRQIKKELMEDGSHYGQLPGVNKPALLKPGAEVLCSIYSLRPDFIPDVRYGDGVTAPHVAVTMRCELHLGDLQGPVVAVGYGAANSWERKHRYRTSERACPSCGTEGTVKRSGFENRAGKFKGQKGWWCKACRTNWDDPKEPAIIDQQVGMVENKDPYDLENTLVKMAKKRAHVDAALTGTASSDLFTQDVEEDAADHEETQQKREPEKKGSKKQQREPGSDDGENAPESCPHDDCDGTEFGTATDGALFCRKCRRPI